MKKQLFFVACAALALASCSEKETVEMPKDAAIGFGTFVDNATRVELDNDNLREFFVFGRMGTDDVLFNNQSVTSADGQSWTYSPKQWWEAGKTYEFIAYAPAIGEGNGTVAPSDDYSKVLFTDFIQGDGDNNLDLIVAEELTPTCSDVNSMEVQKFTFNHILSMVRLTFESEFGDGITLTIKDVKLKGSNSKGSYDGTTWTPAAQAVPADYTLATGEGVNATVSADAVTEGAIVLPQNYAENTVTVTFKVAAVYDESQEYVGGDYPVDGSYDIEATLPVVDGGWAKANRYNYVAKLNRENTVNPDDPNTPKPIEFGLTKVTEWPAYSEAGDASVNAGE